MKHQRDAEDVRQHRVALRVKSGVRANGAIRRWGFDIPRTSNFEPSFVSLVQPVSLRYPVRYFEHAGHRCDEMSLSSLLAINFVIPDSTVLWLSPVGT
ncbi:MAG TPA: hypothetical protein VE222_00510 [Nitrospiraceae bacterium]|nr:hypothetical protein [Nitrospiraceae bacterium]